LRHIKRLLVLVMISIMVLGLIGCGASSSIKLNKKVSVKDEGTDYEYTIKGIEEKDGYYVMAVDITNNFKDQTIAIGIASIRMWVAESQVDRSFILRNKSNGETLIYKDNANFFGSSYDMLNNVDNSHGTVIIKGQETKTIYYPLMDISLYEKEYKKKIESVGELELVYMDVEKGEYIVIE